MRKKSKKKKRINNKIKYLLTITKNYLMMMFRVKRCLLKMYNIIKIKIHEINQLKLTTKKII